MYAATPTGHTIPILHTTGHIVKFKDPVSTTQTYNTQDKPHLLGIIYQSLAVIVILDIVATGLVITTRGANIVGLTTLCPSNKNIAVVGNTIIHATHNNRLPYNLPPSAMEVDVFTTFKNSLIGFKPFSYEGCISIFHPHQGGVTIHHQDKVHIKYLAPSLIKGVREKSGI